jgi:hypothetical protein
MHVPAREISAKIKGPLTCGPDDAASSSKLGITQEEIMKDVK